MRTLVTALATAIIATSPAWKAEAAMVSGVGELPLTKAHSVIERVGSYSRAYGYGYGYGYRPSDIYVYDYGPDPSAYEALEEDPAAMVETPFRAWVLRTPIGIPHDMGAQ